MYDAQIEIKMLSEKKSALRFSCLLLYFTIIYTSHVMLEPDRKEVSLLVENTIQ